MANIKKFTNTNKESTDLGSPIAGDLFRETKPHQIFELLENYATASNLVSKNGGLKSLRKMYENDDEIAAAIDTRHEACVSTPWTLEGGDDEVNEFIYESLAPHLESLISHNWWSVYYGYSVQQVVWDLAFYKETGRLKPECILDQPFEEFVPMRDGTLGRSNGLAAKPIPVEPKEKFVFSVRKPSYHNPSGEALAFRLYYAWIYRQHGWEYLMNLLETWGKPTLHAKTKNVMVPGTNESTVEQLNQLLGGLKRPSAIVTPQDTEINVLQGTGSGALFAQFNKDVLDRILRLVLGQTLTSTTGSSGSQALGNVHDQVRQDKRRSDCKLVAHAVQQLVHHMYTLNNFEGDIPVFKMEDPRGLDTERANRDLVLAQAGQVKFTKKYYLERYDLEDDDFELVQGDEAQLAVLESGTGVSFDQDDMFSFVNRDKLDPRQNASVDVEDEAIKAAGDAIDLDQLDALVKSAKSQKDLESKLELLLDKDDQRFSDTLTLGLYIQRLKGYVDGKENV